MPISQTFEDKAEKKTLTTTKTKLMVLDKSLSDNRKHYILSRIKVMSYLP